MGAGLPGAFVYLALYPRLEQKFTEIYLADISQFSRKVGRFSQTIYRFLDTISAGLATDQHVYVVKILSECDMRYSMLKFLDDLSCEGVSDLLRVGILPCLCRLFSGKSIWLEGDCSRDRFGESRTGEIEA